MHIQILYENGNHMGRKQAPKQYKKAWADFADAGWVLDSRYRFDITVIRNGEKRTQSFAYVFGKLAALLVVHTERAGSVRIISFRYASEAESRAYYEWVENEFEDTE